MEIKLYDLWFNGERICSCIQMNDALIMINALIRTYFSEPTYKIELVELQKCESNDCERREDDGSELRFNN